MALARNIEVGDTIIWQGKEVDVVRTEAGNARPDRTETVFITLSDGSFIIQEADADIVCYQLAV